MTRVNGAISGGAVAAFVFLLVAVAGVGCGELRATKTGTLVLEPDEFVIPKLAAGESIEREVVARNVGTGVLRMINFRGAFSNDFDLYWRLGDDERQRIGIVGGENSFPAAIDLQPEEEMTFSLVFESRGERFPAGRVSFDTNDGANRSVAIPIRSADIGAELALQPRAVDFGRVAAGEVSRQTLTATNVGQADLVISELSINGSSEFGVLLNGEDPIMDPTLLEDPDGDGTPGVVPGGSFEIEVTYTAESVGADSGELVVNSNSVTPMVFVELLANGASPCVQVVPTELEFGAGLLGGLNPQLLTIESCGLEPLRIDSLNLVDENGVYSIDPETVPQLPVFLPAVEIDTDRADYPARNITVFFTPEAEQSYPGQLVIESNDPLRPALEVPLRGRGSQNQCPEARVANEELFVAPLDQVVLDGSFSIDPDDGRPIRYDWVVVQRPMGSVSEPVESFRDPTRPQDGGPFDDPSTPNALLFVDLAGEYLVDLVVTDLQGTQAPSEICPQPEARIRVVAEPWSDIHIQLLWDTPRDADQTDVDGTDLDVHLAHPRAADWFDPLLDCSYLNPSPDWGIPHQTTDDPSLDIDDTNGAGPENVNLDNPEDTSRLGGLYRVGVHYFRSTFSNIGGGNYGSSRASLRVYLGGELAYDNSDNPQELQATNDFWEAGSIVWTEEQQAFNETNRLFQFDPFSQEDGDGN